MEEKIIIHHVGGRGGKRAFVVPSRFTPDIVEVLYDADEQCVQHMQDRDHSGDRTRRMVLPYCIGAREGRGRFLITRDPHASSLLPLNPAMRDWYFHFRKSGLDMIFREVMNPVERRTVRIQSLDSICQSMPPIPAPDIMVLDTQGTEYDVLCGATETLADSAVAVLTEVSFHEVYKGQKLFGDISRLLVRRGFVFVKFPRYLLECAPYRAPVGLRSGGFQTVTNALYFRDIASLRRVKNRKQRALMFAKLAFLACLFDQLEYALQCLAEINTLPQTSAYGAFLAEVRTRVAQAPRRFPRTFSKVQLSGIVSQSTDPLSENFRRTALRTADSSLEALFRRYGLITQADDIKIVRCLGEYALRGHTQK